MSTISQLSAAMASQGYTHLGKLVLIYLANNGQSAGDIALESLAHYAEANNDEIMEALQELHERGAITLQYQLNLES